MNDVVKVKKVKKKTIAQIVPEKEVAEVTVAPHSKADLFKAKNVVVQGKMFGGFNPITKEEVWIQLTEIP
jgi:hypothetical protein